MEGSDAGPQVRATGDARGSRPLPVKLTRTWRLRRPNPGQVRRLSEALRLPELVCGLMVNRQITEPADAERYLNPRLGDLVDPSRLKGMGPAVELLLEHLDLGHRVTIYGDYDVDGMTSASILTRFLRRSGYEPHVFLPDRFKDGYGLNPDRLRELADSGTRLFVSVDCGITAVAPIALARSMGADFIVVDHHQLPLGDLPPANVIINPHQPDCSFPFDDLCAAGLCFHLAIALRVALRKRGHYADRVEPDLRELVDLAAIGTVADVVPLKGINRILVASGLRSISRSTHAGVRALLALSSQGRPINAGTLGFQIGPRLNAAGRLSHPFKGFELLTTDDPDLAQSIASEVDGENRRRRDVQDIIEREALEQTADDASVRPAYLLWSESWHAGVTGVVASRIVERYHRPCAMVALVDGMGKGSIRSIRGFDAVAGLRRCAPLLEQFGGHAHAAGLTVRPERLPELRAAFEAAALDMTPAASLRPELHLDAEVGFRDIDDSLLEGLARLAPYGAGNREPKLCTYGVRVAQVRRVGDGSHVRLELEHEGRRLGAIAFGFGEVAPDEGAHIDVAFRPEYNHWRGQATLQLKVADMKPSAGD